VIFHDTNEQFATWIVSGAHIEDVTLVNSKPEPPPVPQPSSSRQDPAIMSFTRPKNTPPIVSSQNRQFFGHSQPFSTPVPVKASSSLNQSREPVEIEGLAISPAGSSKAPKASISKILNRVGEAKDEKQLRVLHEEISVLLDGKSSAGDEERPKGRTRAKNKNPYKGKGWRETPILKEKDPEESTQRTGNGKQKQRKKKVFKDEQAGWATEDATDVQAMGDFDFAGSLAKFDKKQVFDQLRKEDSIPHENRLVGHNKIARPRPGTFGGTKLHPTEMVLDGPARTGSAAGRRGSHRTPIPAATSDTDARTTAHLHRRGTVDPIPKPSRTSTGVSQRGISRKSTTIATSVASLDTAPYFTPSSSSPKLQSNNYSKTQDVHFLYQEHSVACPIVTPGGMTALEKISNSIFHSNAELSNENAGRTLAEIIISELHLPKNARLVAKDSLTAILFVGNHRSGARALVAARHLRSRGITCVCCVLGLDRPGHTLDPEVEKQLSMIGTPDTVVANWREVQKYLAHKEESGQDAELWVDALLATGHGYDTLVPDEQQAIREIVYWINRRFSSSGRLVLSVDVPCGINPSSGRSNYRLERC
jgi:enhancer of mRNA-decapping protein 3